ncbi:glutamine synthetase family protein [Novosphingobium cyanobacteriorum]|uniref:Glutamine synthetase family protein n=1 Tax=Novosphingobium cyanobacteriorum TaxID=3024215 RepID=A0ABT6CLC8_9SPHN|nr:glutamine synthetase family protein [Novosphingobium cyanobacteriorum]MDF8334721.1 glutamine synthetase family protein [Novosphingobium cyanobacteriorum]
MAENFAEWIRAKGIDEVECLVPDINGVVRGKVWPAGKFVASSDMSSLRLPSSVFSVTITGDYADTDHMDALYRDPDVTLKPDLRSICVAPGFRTPTAFVVADAMHRDGTPFEIAPRYVLQRVLDEFTAMGWKMVVAPELEFYLTEVNSDPDLPIVPPRGRSGRAESSPQPYGLESVTEFEDIIEEIYDNSEIADLQLDTMIHEGGTAQLEINFNHGEPIALCDQVTIFKRIVRQVALKHGVYATFMAKPMESQPGSAMHLHISAQDADGNNLFAGEDGFSPEFRHFVGGLQRYLPEVAPLFAPNVNSFRRMRPAHSAPINVQWGLDNRSCGLRVPVSEPAATRIENRLPGADANPYIAIAATLACGLIGLREKIEPLPLINGNAYLEDRTLPRNLDAALRLMVACEPVKAILGESFITAFARIKQAELEAYDEVISSWERDHLLLKA